ncbi:MAG: amino acid permease [Alphaproteobacteria bacterium]|nr:amino acid permease [Alphaproteobacteria bacterium]
MNLFRTKSIDDIAAHSNESTLRRTLSATDLIMLGVGATIGAGIFVLSGHAAALHAGPAVILSFVLSGFACALAAYCYSELASMFPVAGSAYTYSYVAFGEVIAWIIGWALVLELSFGASAVAIGWSGYLASFLKESGIPLPDALTASANIPAMLIILAVTTILSLGIKLSSVVNLGIVILKVAVILIFVAAGFFHVNFENYTPFMPFGFNGVVTGAALVFFAYLGFDIVATTAQETKNPQKDMPVGILGSLGVCTILYLLVAAVLVGVISYTELNVAAPIATALDHINLSILSPLIKIGAIAGLTTAMLGLLLGQVRIFYAMGRDGLLPGLAAKVSPKYGTPMIATWIVGIAVALLAGFAPMGKLAELVSIGTLFAFTVVCAGVLVLRYQKPDLVRVFRAPFFPLLPIAGIGVNFYLMLGLPLITWQYFLAWAVIGLVIYFTYGRKHSALNNRAV